MKAILTLVLVSVLAAGGACSASSTAGGSGRGPVTITAVAAEDTWGDLLRQLAGDRVAVSNIISGSGVDPHDYDPRPSDSVAIADAQLVVVNGVGYDAWTSKLIDANPSTDRVLIDVGKVVGARRGDNPHRWYYPGDVHRVVGEMTAALKRVDPADSAYFDIRASLFTAEGLEAYDDQIARIRAAYAGTPIAISESIFMGMADALDLRVLTPPAFFDAIAEGNEPTAQDKQAVDRQIAEQQVEVFVYNSQNATPDVQALTDAAAKAGIPVAAVTETLSPPGATFQRWQLRQLADLEGALATATGRPPERGAGP